MHERDCLDGITQSENNSEEIQLSVEKLKDFGVVAGYMWVVE